MKEGYYHESRIKKFFLKERNGLVQSKEKVGLCFGFWRVTISFYNNASLNGLLLYAAEHVGPCSTLSLECWA